MSLSSRWVTRNERGVTDLNVVKLAIDVIVALVLVISLWVFNPFQSVPTGSRGVVTQFGRIVSIADEGLAIIPPWRKLALFNIRAEAADVDNALGATKDTQPVTVSLTVRYSIFPNKVSEVYEKYSHDGDLQSYIQTATQEVFKAVTAKYTAPDLISKRAQVSADITAALTAKVGKYGAQIINIDMKNFAFSDSYMRAIGAKVEQEQLRLVAENKLLTVEAEQKQKVAVAEAEASAVRASADGQAYATLKNATAAADALRIQGKALDENPRILELRKIDVEMAKAGRWNGALPQAIYAGAPIPFMSIPKDE